MVRQWQFRSEIRRDFNIKDLVLYSWKKLNALRAKNMDRISSWLSPVSFAIGDQLRHLSWTQRLAHQCTFRLMVFLPSFALLCTGVGTRQYYRKLGYQLDGPYMSKRLSDYDDDEGLNASKG
jgi:hypothetical protein